MTALTLAPDAPPIPAHHIIVHFGTGINSDTQGKALLHLERYLRETMGVQAEVYKATLPDDLKRRRDMTPEMRENL